MTSVVTPFNGFIGALRVFPGAIVSQRRTAG